METIKQRLREVIEKSGMPVKELASRIGVTPEMVTQYKTTKKMPSLDVFSAICLTLNVSADYILLGKKKPI